MVGEGLAPPLFSEFRLRRRFARPTPGEQALRSSGGECGPDSAACGGRAWSDERVVNPKRTGTRLRACSFWRRHPESDRG